MKTLPKFDDVLQFWRLDDFQSSIGRSKSMLYLDQQKGLFPKPVQLGGARASSYLKHEVQAVIAARVAGYNNEQIKALVSKLVSQRPEILKGVLAQIDELTNRSVK